MASWIDHAVFWHVYPLGFVDAPSVAHHDEPVARLRRLEAWLDYVIELGANGLLLGPVFVAETHGYDTVDHFRIDARLGTDDDFDALIAAAKSRGIRVVLDGVFNHVARTFPNIDELARRKSDGSIATFEGHDHLVVLNHDDARVVDIVVAVMDYWLARGADGWRLDAAYAVPPTFWRDVLDTVRQRHPHSWFVAEMIHGDYARYVADSGVDSVTQYELWKAVWSSLNDRNFFELAHALKRHDGLLDTFVPQTFLGNHDVTRIASRLRDPKTMPLALAVLFTVGGIPSVYAGDERAFTGVKEDRAGGDDAIRPPFPATPGGLSDDGLEQYRLHQQLIGYRRNRPWLVRARTEVVDVTNTRLTYVTRGDSDQVLVTLDLEGERPTWAVS